MSFVQAVLVNTSKLPAVYWVATQNNEIGRRINDKTSEQEIEYKKIVIAPGCYSREMLELKD